MPEAAKYRALKPPKSGVMSHLCPIFTDARKLGKRHDYDRSRIAPGNPLANLPKGGRKYVHRANRYGNFVR